MDLNYFVHTLTLVGFGPVGFCVIINYFIQHHDQKLIMMQKMNQEMLV